MKVYGRDWLIQSYHLLVKYKGGEGLINFLSLKGAEAY